MVMKEMMNWCEMRGVW